MRFGRRVAVRIGGAARLSRLASRFEVRRTPQFGNLEWRVANPWLTTRADAYRRNLPHREALARRLLNPDVLTLGFARRFATHKRPNLLLHDPERLVRLLTNWRESSARGFDREARGLSF
jgi:hypothetical protein